MARFTAPGCDSAHGDKKNWSRHRQELPRRVSEIELVKSLVARVTRRAVNHLLSGWTVVLSQSIVSSLQIMSSGFSGHPGN